MVTHQNKFNQTLDLLKHSVFKADQLINRIGRNKYIIILFFSLAIFISFAVVLLLNILTPQISDDFAYMFIYGDFSKRITSIQDIIQSQINHYHMWGGRSIVHFIAQWLLLIPPLAADILNTIIYLFYIILIYYFVKGKNEHSLFLFILINLAVWFMQPVLGDTVFWITGSANYLWGTTIILLFLLPYRLYDGDKKAGGLLSTFIKTIIMILFGVIAGWTNENTGGAMLLIILLFIFRYYVLDWKLPVWGLLGFASALIGYLIMIMAPGNFKRAGEAVSFDPLVLGFRLFNCTSMLVQYCALGVLVFLIMIILYYYFSSLKRNDKNDVMTISFIFFIAAIAAVYAMFLSPAFPRRAMFGVVTYLIIAIGILYYNLDFKSYTFLRYIRLSIVFIGFISFTFSLYTAITEINGFRKISAQRIEIIKEAKNNSVDFCEFDRYLGGLYIHGEDPFSEELLSYYYGIRIKLRD